MSLKITDILIASGRYMLDEYGFLMFDENGRLIENPEYKTGAQQSYDERYQALYESLSETDDVQYDTDENGNKIIMVGDKKHHKMFVLTNQSTGGGFDLAEYVAQSLTVKNYNSINSFFQYILQKGGGLTEEYAKWAVFSYDEILEMEANGTVIPDAVLEWAHEQRSIYEPQTDPFYQDNEMESLLKDLDSQFMPKENLNEVSMAPNSEVLTNFEASSDDEVVQKEKAKDEITKAKDNVQDILSDEDALSEYNLSSKGLFSKIKESGTKSTKMAKEAAQEVKAAKKKVKKAVSERNQLEEQSKTLKGKNKAPKKTNEEIAVEESIAQLDEELATKDKESLSGIEKLEAFKDINKDYDEYLGTTNVVMGTTAALGTNATASGILSIELGAALISTGTALLSNPFTAAFGATLVSMGTYYVTFGSVITGVGGALIGTGIAGGVMVDESDVQVEVSDASIDESIALMNEEEVPQRNIAEQELLDMQMDGASLLEQTVAFEAKSTKEAAETAADEIELGVMGLNSELAEKRSDTLAEKVEQKSEKENKKIEKLEEKRENFNEKIQQAKVEGKLPEISQNEYFSTGDIEKLQRTQENLHDMGTEGQTKLGEDLKEVYTMYEKSETGDFTGETPMAYGNVTLGLSEELAKKSAAFGLFGIPGLMASAAAAISGAAAVQAGEDIQAVHEKASQKINSALDSIGEDQTTVEDSTGIQATVTVSDNQQEEQDGEQNQDGETSSDRVKTEDGTEQSDAVGTQVEGENVVNPQIEGNDVIGTQVEQIDGVNPQIEAAQLDRQLQENENPQAEFQSEEVFVENLSEYVEQIVDEITQTGKESEMMAADAKNDGDARFAAIENLKAAAQNGGEEETDVVTNAKKVSGRRGAPPAGGGEDIPEEEGDSSSEDGATPNAVGAGKMNLASANGMVGIEKFEQYKEINESFAEFVESNADGMQDMVQTGAMLSAMAVPMMMLGMEGGEEMFEEGGKLIKAGKEGQNAVKTSLAQIKVSDVAIENAIDKAEDDPKMDGSEKSNNGSGSDDGFDDVNASNALDKGAEAKSGLGKIIGDTKEDNAESVKRKGESEKTEKQVENQQKVTEKLIEIEKKKIEKAIKDTVKSAQEQELLSAEFEILDAQNVSATAKLEASQEAAEEAAATAASDASSDMAVGGPRKTAGRNANPISVDSNLVTQIQSNEGRISEIATRTDSLSQRIAKNHKLITRSSIKIRKYQTKFDKLKKEKLKIQEQTRKAEEAKQKKIETNLAIVNVFNTLGAILISIGSIICMTGLGSAVGGPIMIAGAAVVLVCGSAKAGIEIANGNLAAGLMTLAMTIVQVVMAVIPAAGGMASAAAGTAAGAASTAASAASTAAGAASTATSAAGTAASIGVSEGMQIAASAISITQGTLQMADDITFIKTGKRNEDLQIANQVLGALGALTSLGNMKFDDPQTIIDSIGKILNATGQVLTTSGTAAAQIRKQYGAHRDTDAENTVALIGSIFSAVGSLTSVASSDGGNTSADKAKLAGQVIGTAGQLTKSVAQTTAANKLRDGKKDTRADQIAMAIGDTLAVSGSLISNISGMAKSGINDIQDATNLTRTIGNTISSIGSIVAQFGKISGKNIEAAQYLQIIGQSINMIAALVDAGAELADRVGQAAAAGDAAGDDGGDGGGAAAADGAGGDAADGGTDKVGGGNNAGGGATDGAGNAITNNGTALFGTTINNEDDIPFLGSHADGTTTVNPDDLDKLSSEFLSKVSTFDVADIKEFTQKDLDAGMERIKEGLATNWGKNNPIDTKGFENALNEINKKTASIENAQKAANVMNQLSNTISLLGGIIGGIMSLSGNKNVTVSQYLQLVGQSLNSVAAIVNMSANAATNILNRKQENAQNLVTEQLATKDSEEVGKQLYEAQDAARKELGADATQEDIQKLAAQKVAQQMLEGTEEDDITKEFAQQQLTDQLVVVQEAANNKDEYSPDQQKERLTSRFDAVQKVAKEQYTANLPTSEQDLTKTQRKIKNIENTRLAAQIINHIGNTVTALASTVQNIMIANGKGNVPVGQYMQLVGQSIGVVAAVVNMSADISTSIQARKQDQANEIVAEKLANADKDKIGEDLDNAQKAAREELGTNATDEEVKQFAAQMVAQQMLEDTKEDDITKEYAQQRLVAQLVEVQNEAETEERPKKELFASNFEQVQTVAQLQHAEYQKTAKERRQERKELRQAYNAAQKDAKGTLKLRKQIGEIDDKIDRLTGRQEALKQPVIKEEVVATTPDGGNAEPTPEQKAIQVVAQVFEDINSDTFAEQLIQAQEIARQQLAQDKPNEEITIEEIQERTAQNLVAQMLEKQKVEDEQVKALATTNLQEQFIAIQKTIETPITTAKTDQTVTGAAAPIQSTSQASQQQGQGQEQGQSQNQGQQPQPQQPQPRQLTPEQRVDLTVAQVLTEINSEDFAEQLQRAKEEIQQAQQVIITSPEPQPKVLAAEVLTQIETPALINNIITTQEAVTEELRQTQPDAEPEKATVFLSVAEKIATDMVNTTLPQDTDNDTKHAVITELTTQIVTLQQAAAEKTPPAPVQATPQTMEEILTTEIETAKQVASQTIEEQPEPQSTEPVTVLTEDEINQQIARNFAENYAISHNVGEDELVIDELTEQFETILETANAGQQQSQEQRQQTLVNKVQEIQQEQQEVIRTLTQPVVPESEDAGNVVKTSTQIKKLTDAIEAAKTSTKAAAETIVIAPTPTDEVASEPAEATTEKPEETKAVVPETSLSKFVRLGNKKEKLEKRKEKLEKELQERLEKLTPQARAEQIITQEDEQAVVQNQVTATEITTNVDQMKAGNIQNVQSISATQKAAIAGQYIMQFSQMISTVAAISASLKQAQGVRDLDPERYLQLIGQSVAAAGSVIRLGAETNAMIQQKARMREQEMQNLESFAFANPEIKKQLGDFNPNDPNSIRAWEEAKLKQDTLRKKQQIQEKRKEGDDRYINSDGTINENKIMRDFMQEETNRRMQQNAQINDAIIKYQTQMAQVFGAVGQSAVAFAESQAASNYYKKNSTLDLSASRKGQSLIQEIKSKRDA